MQYWIMAATFVIVAAWVAIARWREKTLATKMIKFLEDFSKQVERTRNEEKEKQGKEHKD